MSGARKTTKRKKTDSRIGTCGWIDLTVGDVERVRDFYGKVVGWKPVGIPMGGYADYAMVPPASEAPVAGVCTKRGVNADVPSQWLVYWYVASVKRSIAAAKRGGGKVLVGPREQGGGQFAVIRDPAGAVCALFEPPAD